VSLKVAEHQTEGYRVNTKVYEGPLDLLLELIEKAELDITSLALAQVTDQYLGYLKTMEERDPAEVSAFLVIAARLVQIKSAVLLPKPPVTDNLTEEEDPGEALARQLIEYRRFKQIAGGLEVRESENLRTYLRLSTLPIKIEPKLDLSDLTLEAFLKAAKRALTAKPDPDSLNTAVKKPRITIRQKIKSILDYLKQQPNGYFSKIYKTNNRVEIVVSFLALLELVKRRYVFAQQEALFADIFFENSGEWQGEEIADIEFLD
jgi:segregation and condensation protein A